MKDLLLEYAFQVMGKRCPKFEELLRLALLDDAGLWRKFVENHSLEEYLPTVVQFAVLLIDSFAGNLDEGLHFFLEWLNVTFGGLLYYFIGCPTTFFCFRFEHVQLRPTIVKIHQYGSIQIARIRNWQKYLVQKYALFPALSDVGFDDEMQQRDVVVLGFNIFQFAENFQSESVGLAAGSITPVHVVSKCQDDRKQMFELLAIDQKLTRVLDCFEFSCHSDVMFVKLGLEDDAGDSFRKRRDIRNS